ncbi:hypothetical protein B0J12DRAFT_773529 [Macrophomina phaseolina]|uniref:Uncharacterized protein n=1 Tax=Macrophomina phaseolina TaxID=35725 RepID=A0ABQ8FSN9_9PEZI|nr:hypothetical protein B0J12DRAFT_773529 [Macrophomina phaseolina]
MAGLRKPRDTALHCCSRVPSCHWRVGTQQRGTCNVQQPMRQRAEAGEAGGQRPPGASGAAAELHRANAAMQVSAADAEAYEHHHHHHHHQAFRAFPDRGVAAFAGHTLLLMSPAGRASSLLPALLRIDRVDGTVQPASPSRTRLPASTLARLHTVSARRSRGLCRSNTAGRAQAPASQRHCPARTLPLASPSREDHGASDSRICTATEPGLRILSGPAALCSHSLAGETHLSVPLFPAPACSSASALR